MERFKLSLIVSLFLFLALNLNAQENYYEAGQLHFGPHIGVSLGFHTNKDIFVGYDIGAYGGYSFTDLLGVNVSALYGRELGIGQKINYLKVPVLLLFQFNSNHLGIGFQYNHPLTQIDKLLYTSISNNHLSCIIEFGSHSSVFNVFSALLDDNSSIFRSLIRVGYAITPTSYVYQEITSEDVYRLVEYKNNPFFVELALQYNIGQHFNDKKYTRTRR